MFGSNGVRICVAPRQIVKYYCVKTSRQLNNDAGIVHILRTQTIDLLTTLLQSVTYSSRNNRGALLHDSDQLDVLLDEV